MDKFGQEVFTINGKMLNLPRAGTCRKVYKNTKLLVMSQNSPYAYCITPHINEKHYSDKESLLKIKEIVWHNFFGHAEEYKFDESHHYPKPFKTYLDYKLGLNIKPEEVDMFIVMIRNSVFDRVVYTCNPRLVAAANWITDGVLRMTDSYFYVFRPGWPEWSKFDVQEN